MDLARVVVPSGDGVTLPGPLHGHRPRPMSISENKQNRGAPSNDISFEKNEAHAWCAGSGALRVANTDPERRHKTNENWKRNGRGPREATARGGHAALLDRQLAGVRERFVHAGP